MTVYKKWATAHQTMLWFVVIVTITTCLVHITFTLANEEVMEVEAGAKDLGSQNAHQGLFFERVKRAPNAGANNNEEAGDHDDEGSAEDTQEPEPKSDDPKKGKGEGVSLGQILGLVFIICCIFYCVGISWKIFKICKGTYVEEEPVFLKYK